LPAPAPAEFVEGRNVTAKLAIDFAELMTEQSVSVFDCEDPDAARLIESFFVSGDGRARLRQFSRTSGVELDSFLALFSMGCIDALISPNSDGTYFLSDFAPNGWGARFIARQLLEESRSVPSSVMGWLAQSSSFALDVL